MFKKAILIVIVGLFLNTLSAQDKKPWQLLKYVTTAPDGTTSITIFDDSRSATIQLEAALDFYKYQLIDIDTNKRVYTQSNRGNKGMIDKLKVADGTYDLRLYTKNFIISSRITIAKFQTNSLAINDD